MSAPNAILARLETGRPLLLGTDPTTGLAARGVHVADAVELGRVIRERPEAIADLYHHEIASGIDVLAALTAETMPRALHRLGMAFRSAAITGTAVELALDAAELATHPIVVAGVLGSSTLPPFAGSRMAEEYAMHAARLAAAGCELIIARGFDASANDASTADVIASRTSRHAAISSATATELPTWAVVTVDASGRTPDGESIEDAADVAREAGAQALLVETRDFDCASLAFAKLREADEPMRIGAIVGTNLSSASDEMNWAASAKRLIDGGARVLGGGPGTTHRYLAALSAMLRGTERPSIWPRAI